MSKINIKKPKAIVLELTGTLVTREFMSYSEQRKDFVKANIIVYFNECYPKNKELRSDINFFKMQEISEINDNIFNQNCPKINELNHKFPTIEVAINHILWRLDNDFNSKALTLFLLHFNEWAYKKGIFVTPVYDEIKNVLENWHNLNIAIYVDVASANFVNMILSSTNQGNLIPFFSGHMNLIYFDGQKSIRNFEVLPSMLELEPKDILFITRFPEDAIAAKKTGILTFLLLREDFHPNYKQLIEQADYEKLNNQNLCNDDKISDMLENKRTNLVNEKDNIERYKSGLFRISNLNQKNQEQSKLIAENLTNKLTTMYDSLESICDFNEKSFLTKDNSNVISNQRNQSKLCINDLVQSKYIFNLSDISFI